MSIYLENEEMKLCGVVCPVLKKYIYWESHHGRTGGGGGFDQKSGGGGSFGGRGPCGGEVIGGLAGVIGGRGQGLIFAKGFGFGLGRVRPGPLSLPTGYGLLGLGRAILLGTSAP